MCVSRFFPLFNIHRCCHFSVYGQWKEVASVLISSVVQSQTTGCFAGDWGALWIFFSGLEVVGRFLCHPQPIVVCSEVLLFLTYALSVSKEIQCH